MSDFTRLLDRARLGEAKAAEELLPLVYTELSRLAAAKMAQQPPGHTLQATALVHEASPAQRQVQAGAPKSKFLSAKVKSCCSEGGSPSSLGRKAPEFRTKELDGKV